MTEPQTDSPAAAAAALNALGQAMETPQAAPQVGQPPDTTTLAPPSQGGTGAPDYQAQFQEERKRRQGVDQRLREETAQRQALETRLSNIEQMLAQQPPVAGEPPPPQASVPVGQQTSVTEPQAPTQTDLLQQAIQSRQAEQYRDLLIAQYEAELGVPLSMFKDRIAIKPLQYGADGSIDDTAQRTEIQTMAQALQEVQGQTARQTQETMLTGQTPGSAPGAPVATTGEDVYQEFLDLSEAQGSEAFQKLDRAEQNRIEARYLELLNHPVVEQMHEGETRPAMDFKEMQDTVRRLARESNARSVQNLRPTQAI